MLSFQKKKSKCASICVKINLVNVKVLQHGRCNSKIQGSEILHVSELFLYMYFQVYLAIGAFGISCQSYNVCI